jgi:hypothetical protein
MRRVLLTSVYVRTYSAISGLLHLNPRPQDNPGPAEIPEPADYS